MPNALQLLKDDHRKVEQLFEEFEESSEHSVVLQICQELTAHAIVEEELLYPVLKRIDPENYTDAEAEHSEAKQLIARLESMSPEDTHLEAVVMELKGVITHHVEEEEGEIFDELQKELGKELDEVGDRIIERKQAMGMPTDRGDSGAAGALDDMTKEELYEKAQAAGIEGRSSMSKEELIKALS